MRETLLEKAGDGTMKVVTGTRGTDVLDAEGKAVATRGTDRHDEMVERYEGEGWSAAAGRAVAPAAVAGAAPADTGPAENDAAATVSPETS